MIEGVRGVRSIEGSDAIKYTKIINTFHNLCIENNFELIVLPTLEKVDLFSRTVGEFTDIVTKQMYNFKDKKGREIVLRPEGTAGVMRNYIDKKYNIEKFYFYSEQMFRYERPQKGRFREFHQVGAEIIGSTIGNIKPISQIVLLGKNFIDKLYDNKNEIELKINSIGTNQDRKKYINKLDEYFQKHKSSLSEDSKIRLINNPLRILDSIDKKDIKISHDAPKFSEYRSETSNKEYELFKEQISSIPYKEDENLVRGLDYYNGITFEIRLKINQGHKTH